MAHEPIAGNTLNQKHRFRSIAVVGAGAMGRGIAQIMAQIGIPTRLLDQDQDAVLKARSSLHSTWAAMLEKGRLSDAQYHQALDAIGVAERLEDVADCDLVIEAIVERLDIKQSLFHKLETIVSDEAVIASNTSSLSIAAMAAGLRRPERFAGYHFFNPVPLMKIVEVVRGIHTASWVIDSLSNLATEAGHRAVVCGDTPGFIVNHAGRGFGTESLRALAEQVAPVQVIDAILRDQVQFDGKGFRLGPFELMDLTAIDVSHPVMESIYRQYYEEPRYKPSVITAQRLAAGLFGRKTGQGFYRYLEGKKQDLDWPQMPAPDEDALTDDFSVWIAPMSEAQPLWVRESLRDLIMEAGFRIENSEQASADALIVLCPLGEDASAMAYRLGLDGRRCVALDTLFAFGWQQCKLRSLMATVTTSHVTMGKAMRLFGRDGARLAWLNDSPGFISQRVIGMIVSIACDMAQQSVAEAESIDDAVRIGLGYPLGPLSMGNALGPQRMLAIMDGIHQVTQDPRYRPSLWLRRRAQAGESLLHHPVSLGS